MNSRGLSPDMPFDYKLAIFGGVLSCDTGCSFICLCRVSIPCFMYASPFVKYSPNAHDDVIKWKYFARYRPSVARVARWPVESPRKGQWRQSFGDFFDLRLNKQLSKPLRRWWCEKPSHSLWRNCNAVDCGLDIMEHDITDCLIFTSSPKQIRNWIQYSILPFLLLVHSDWFSFDHRS